MKLLKRLFSSKDKNAKPSKAKVQTAERLYKSLDEQSPDELLKVAQAETNDELREAAIARLAYSTDLLKMAQENGGRWPLLARKRIGQLLEDDQLSIKKLGADLSDQGQLLSLAAYSPKALQEVIEQVQNPALLLQLATEGTTTQARQAAAARIHSRAELEQLCKLAQGKDKSVYKLARARLDEFKAEDTRHADARAQLTSICEKLEKLTRLEADAVYKARITLLENEWQLQADAATEELLQRYQSALASCHQQIAARAEQIAQAEQEALLDQQAKDFVARANQDIHHLLLVLFELEDTSALAQYQQQLNDLNQAVRLASQRPLDFGKALKEFERANQFAQFWLEQMTHGTLTQLKARHAHSQIHALLRAAQEFYRAELPTPLANLAEVLSAHEAEERKAQAAEKKLEHDLGELVRRGLWAARDGMVRKARGIHKEVTEKRPGLHHTSPALQSKLDELDAAIAQLSDWHEFAVTPKKEALIEQMTTLQNSQLAPQDLATRIHDLQDEWKSLSKGVQQADENLWQQFQQASQAAYAPCREFFDAQAKAREENLKHRQTLITQLTTYLNEYHWDTPVWSDVEKTLKVARQEWQAYWPVPRKAGEDLQHQFDQLMEDLHARLKAHYQESKAAKQALIAQAHSCVEDPDLHTATNRIKQLQQQWKTLGKSYPKDEQQLWQAFRRECDAVFARRNEQQAARQQAQAAQAEAAEKLIAQLQTLASNPDADAAKIRADMADIKQAFQALEDLPRDKAKDLQARFNQGFKALENQLVAQRNQAEIRRWQDLYALADQLRQAELKLLQGQTSADGLSTLLENPPSLPSAGLAQLQARARTAADLTAADQASHRDALQLLCIRAEILSGRETPADDKSLRMDYQLQQLQQGLGKKEETLEELAIEWVGIGAVDDASYALLFNRFMASLAQHRDK